MKITSVELHPGGSAAVAVLSFRDPGSQNPFNVKTITGLDADEIVSRFYGGSGNSARFFSLAMERREVGIRVGLNPRWALNESYAGLRDDIYRLIASSRTGLLEIQFKNGAEVVAVISGFVSKVEAPQFEKTQEVTITVQCDENPMLQAPALENIAMDVWPPSSINLPDLKSTAPHGFIFDMAFSVARASLSLSGDDWSFVVTPAGGFLIGDVLHFSSEHDNKMLYITRGAATIHLADKIAPGSVWPIMFPGDNPINLGDFTGVTIPYLAHKPTYWGV